MPKTYFIVCENSAPTELLSPKQVMKDLSGDTVVFNREEDAAKYCVKMKESEQRYTHRQPYNRSPSEYDGLTIETLDNNQIKITLKGSPFKREEILLAALDEENIKTLNVETKLNGIVTIKGSKEQFQLHFSHPDVALDGNQPAQTIVSVENRIRYIKVGELEQEDYGDEIRIKSTGLKEDGTYYRVETVDNFYLLNTSSDVHKEPKENLIIVEVEMKHDINSDRSKRLASFPAPKEKGKDFRFGEPMDIFFDPAKTFVTSTGNLQLEEFIVYENMSNPTIHAFIKAQKADGSSEFTFPPEQRKIRLLREFVFQPGSQVTGATLVDVIKPEELHQLFFDLNAEVENDVEKKQRLEEKSAELMDAYIGNRSADQVSQKNIPSSNSSPGVAGKPPNRVVRFLYAIFSRILPIFLINKFFPAFKTKTQEVGIKGQPLNTKKSHFYHVIYSKEGHESYLAGRKVLKEERDHTNSQVRTFEIKKPKEISKQVTTAANEQHSNEMTFFKGTAAQKERFDAYVHFHEQYKKLLENEAKSKGQYHNLVNTLSEDCAKLKQLLDPGNFGIRNKTLEDALTFLSNAQNAKYWDNGSLDNFSKNLDKLCNELSGTHHDYHNNAGVQALAKVFATKSEQVKPIIEDLKNSNNKIATLMQNTESFLKKSKEESQKFVEAHSYKPNNKR